MSAAVSSLSSTPAGPLGSDLPVPAPAGAAGGPTWAEAPSLRPGLKLGLLAGVLLGHAALAWWLMSLSPHRQPTPPEAGAISVAWIEPAPEPVAPPEPQPRPPEPQVRPQPQPQPRPRAEVPPPPAQPVPVIATPAVVERAEPAAVSAPPAPAEPAPSPAAVSAVDVAVRPAAPTGPPAEPRLVSKTSVSCYERPEAVYPAASQRLDEQGSGVARLHLDTQGRPSRVELLRSTGYPRLDQAQIKALWAYRCKPYLENGVAMAIRVDQPFSFALDPE